MFFLVPLPDDIIETKSGVKHTVLSYAPHADEPAVYVEGEGTPTIVEFSEINRINGAPVRLATGGVLEATSKIKRDLQLPQRFDKVFINDRAIKVKSLKLRDKKNLTKGMFVVGEDHETGEKLTLRLADIAKLERSSGDEQFTRRGFAKLYTDYLGSSA